MGSHPWWLAILLGCIYKQVRHCTHSIVDRAMQEGYQPWKPINCPVNYKSPSNKTMMPSRCQRLFGPATEYARRETVIARRILTLRGSTRARHLWTRSRCILNPSDLKWPKTIEVPTKQPCSFRKALTLLSNCSSVMSLKRDRWVRPNSDTLRWIVQRETSNIREMSSQLKPRERSSTNVSSLMSNFGLQTCLVSTLLWWT